MRSLLLGWAGSRRVVVAVVRCISPLVFWFLVVAVDATKDRSR